MALRPLVDTELEQFGLENDAQAIQEAAALKPLAPKQVENLKLLRKGTMAYNLAEKYKEAWGLDAETFAQRAEVKDTTGLPDFVLDRKPEIIKETIDKKKYENAPKVDWDEMEKAYPITGNFLGANMNFAWDDIDNLKKHESLWSKLGTSFKVGMDIGTLGRLGERQMYFNREDPELEKTITTLEKSIEERKTKLAESGLGERMVQGLGEITGQQGEAIRNAAIYGSLGMLLGGPFGGVGGLAVGGASAATGALSGLTVGATFGAAKSVYSMEAGSAWREFRQIPGMDDDSAALAASIVGLGNAGIEMLTFKSIVNPFKTAFAKMGIGGAEANRKAMLMLLQRPTVQKAFKDFVKTYGKNYIENVAQEVAQQGVTQFGGILAADLSDITGTKYTDLNQFMTALYEEAKGAAEMFALVPMLGSATNLSVDLTRANRAVQNTELFNELALSAKDSKVRQRLPRAYRELIASATKDGGLETIYIDSEKFQTVFGQSASDVAEELGITDEYENSLKEGGDLAVNTAVYAEKIAGTDAHAGLAGGIRLKEGEMTADEAQEFLGEYEANKQRSIEEAKEAIAKEDEYGADLEIVRQETKNMLLSNGLPAEEAESNALLWSAWVNVLAKQRGVMPSEQNKEIGMRIGLPEDSGVTLGQTENEIKQRQFKIISTSNPMKDDIHTGIRTIEDIKTALEVFSESTDGFTDDFTKEDMDNALARDEVIVYSSNPITNGVFVTPSKQEAESYSGGGMVYSTKVRLGDIAWIDEGQGQYAPTSDISTPDIRYQTEIIKQAISSADTSLKQISATFKSKYFKAGKLNYDIGGGKFDLGSEYINKQYGTENLVFDPFNRDEAYNTEVLRRLQSGEQGDTVTVNSVLNVIKEADIRENVILQASKAVKQDGTAYFLIHEGDRTGNGRITKDKNGRKNWQNHSKADTYIEEVSKYFNTVERHSNLIVAKDPIASNTKAIWFLEETMTREPVLYQSNRGQVSSAEIDNQYLEAVKRGDTDTAQKIVDMMAKNAGYINNNDYRMMHQAPNRQDDINLIELKKSGLVPDDYWTKPQRYQHSPEEWESWRIIKEAITKVDNLSKEGKDTDKVKIWVYRAIPKNIKDSEVRNGDWVSPSRAYAINEGKMIPEGYRIISQWVKVKDIYWDGNSIGEFGYDDGRGYVYKNTKNNRKLIDVITKDNYGFIIPPSKRFNFRVPDIRYQDKRGQVSFTEGQSIISFFKSRDASTFAHEMGHIMLKMTEQYALQSAPDSQMFKDWAVVRNYLSIAEGETLSSIGQDRLTEAHEKFARTFEAYLMTGEAPSVGLRNTFRKFKAWLIGIYKELASLNVEMSPEIKTVFDRMIATEDEIAEVEALANYNKDVSKMENVDMTAEEAELYSSLKEEAEAEARETLLGRLMKPIERMFKKDKQLEYTKALAKKVKEIRAILEKEPVNRIRTLLAIGEKKGGITFDYYESEAIMNDLVSSLGMAVTFGEREISDIDTVIPTFSSRWFRKEGGTDPEVIAMEYGYSSASEMFLDLATARDIDKVAQEKAKAEIDAELNKGIDPESVRLAAEKAIRGKNRLELLGIEWLILAKKGKQALKMASAKARIQAAKNSAQKHLDGLLWKDAIAFKRFIALERKAALAAERAILNKDMDTALAQKELQIINAALASESMARKTSADIMVKYLKNMAGRTRKQTFGIAPDALEQIDTLLEKYEFKKISEKEMAIRKDLTQWIAEQQELGVPIDLPEDMQRQLKQKNFNSLTYSQIEGLYNTIKAIEKIGKGMMLFKKAEEAQSYDEAVDALKKSLEKQKVTRKHITSSDPNMRKLEALHGMPDAINAQLEKAQATLLMLDGTKGIEKPGAFTDILWRPFADAIDTKVILLKDYTGRIDNAIFKHYGRGQWSKFLKRKVFIQELGYSLTGEQMFCVYMNLGTETNKVRLMEGKKWSEQQVEAILSKLDKRALDLGQDIRDIIQTLFPMMKALNREVLGYEPKTEEAVPIVTQYGTYRGGYYPLVIDYSKMVDINRTEEYEQGLSKNQPPFRAATRQGAYKARSAHANYQVRLDLGGLRKHLEEVTHDLAFRKAVIDANKILSNKELRVMIAERVGKVGLQVLDNWVRDVATPPAIPTDRLSTVLRHQRHAITAAIIMYKLSVLMLQSSGWFNSANILGKKTARAMAMYYARPHTWVKDWKFVMDMSPFMVERNGLIETSMREFLLDKQFGQMSRMDKKIAMTLFNFSDGTITIPTWLEGYRIGLDLYKGDIDKAVGYADDIVRQTQGGSSIIDQSKLQRNQSELTKAISMFTQYFNVVYNLARRSGHNIGSVRNVPAFLGSMMILCVAPAIYEGMLRDDDQPEEDEEGLLGGWGKWASIKSVNYAMATVPILRDIGPYTMAKITGVGYQSSLRLSPMTASLESYIRTAKILLDSDAEWEDKLEKGTESASYITGVSLQLHTVAWNLYHYLSDDQPDLDLTDITKKQYRRK